MFDPMTAGKRELGNKTRGLLPRSKQRRSQPSECLKLFFLKKQWRSFLFWCGGRCSERLQLTTAKPFTLTPPPSFPGSVLQWITSHICCSSSPLKHLPFVSNTCLERGSPPKTSISYKAPPFLHVPCNRAQEDRGDGL